MEPIPEELGRPPKSLRRNLGLYPPRRTRSRAIERGGSRSCPSTRLRYGRSGDKVQLAYRCSNEVPLCGETHFRKGIHLLLTAWDQAFPNVDRATLTLKTSSDCPFDSPREDIIIVDQHWSDEELKDAYAEYDFLISASLGEGWGLTIAEAIQAKLPVVANAWGGQGSMLNSQNCFEIPHREILQPFSSIPEFYAEEQMCGYSSPDAIAQTILRASQSTASERRALAEQAFLEFEGRFGKDAASKRIQDRLQAFMPGLTA